MNFYGIENVTAIGNSSVGVRVYWKGIYVDHFSFPFRPEAKDDTEELARACREIESEGREVNQNTYLSKMDEWRKNELARLYQ